MRLRLQLPESWISRARNSQVSEVVIAQGPTEDAELLCWVRWETAIPAGLKSWIADAMGFALPVGCTLRQRSLRRDVSAVGWPVAVVEQDVLDAQGSLVEQRLGIFYRLLEHGAEIVLRIRSRERFEAMKPEILRVLLNGDADWTQAQAPSLFHLRSEGMTLTSLAPEAAGERADGGGRS